jgi:hypothetical protein
VPVGRQLFCADQRIFSGYSQIPSVKAGLHLDAYRSNKVEYKNMTVEGNVTLPGIDGRVVDMEITKYDLVAEE